MREYLMFRLYGPMAAWGDIAVGEYRPTFAHPSKSALLGLIAAALGLRRDEEDAHQKLADSYAIAVLIDNMGILLRDYHTVQAPSAKKGITHGSRRSELSSADLNAIESKRDYRCDALYTVAIWSIGKSPAYKLIDLAEALKHPAFTLYLGRKSCPLALSLHPQIVEGENLKQAFSKANFPDEEMLRYLPKSEYSWIYWERDEESGFMTEGIITRRDNPLSRRRWQFSDRQEYYAGSVIGEEE